MRAGRSGAAPRGPWHRLRPDPHTLPPTPPRATREVTVPGSDSAFPPDFIAICPSPAPQNAMSFPARGPDADRLFRTPRLLQNLETWSHRRWDISDPNRTLS